MARPGDVASLAGFTSQKRQVTLFTFIPPSGFHTLRLARALDSLVRVSRRVDRDRLRSAYSHRRDRDTHGIGAHVPRHDHILPPSEPHVTPTTQTDTLAPHTMRNQLRANAQETPPKRHQPDTNALRKPSTDEATRSNGPYPLPFSSFKYF